MPPHRPAEEPAPLGSWLPGYLALALIWGSSFLLIKVGVAQLHPLYVSLGRVAVGALTLLVVLAVTRGRLPRGWRTWGHLSVVGVIGTAVPFTLFGYGEQRISSALAGIWNATTPLVALPVAILVFRTERLTLRRAVGVLLGFAGVLVVLGVWRGVGGAQLAGQAMCFGAAACYAVAIPYQRRFLSGLPGSGVGVPAGQLITATLALVLVTPLVAGAPPAPASLDPEVVGAVLALGALGTGLAFVLHFRVIRFAGASTSASVTYLLPLVSTVIGLLVLREEVSWYQPVGGLVVLLGVGISQGLLRLPVRRRLRRADPVPRGA
ncbi:MAG TPA: DMT family transporter [Pilimelia sp.]|nr:DMT family transporter [Pilimelia sp.]